MLSNLIIFVDFAVLVLICFSFKMFHKRKSGRRPPGPKGYPLIGNTFDMMVPEIWEVAQKWAKTYGNLIYLNSFGQSVLVIDSYDTAVELLEKRWQNNSDRANSVMLNELQKWGWQFSTKLYGDEWRRLRTPIQEFFGSTNLVHFNSALEKASERLLCDVLRSPKEYKTHIRTAIASSIMVPLYGHEVTSPEDPFVKLAREGVDEISRSLRQGTYLVDIVPWLKHLPKWFPGAGFQAVAERGARLSHDVQYLPYYDARDKILSGSTSIQSFTAQQIEACRGTDGKLSETDDYNISAMSGGTLLAGADTSVAQLMVFLLAMTLYPDVRRRAQTEIDQVIGSVRLPKLSDRAQLPYCAAICKEFQRWNPILPIGVPHSTREDDTYNGYFIPAKTIIMPNQWAMLQDPEEYPDPLVFRPERFLPAKGERMQRDPGKIAFGFGRRICPGRYLAENATFIMAVQFLAIFDIEKSLNENGEVIEPDAKFTDDGLVRHPLPFECTMKPRSREAVELIQPE